MMMRSWFVGGSTTTTTTLLLLVVAAVASDESSSSSSSSSSQQECTVSASDGSTTTCSPQQQQQQQQQQQHDDEVEEPDCGIYMAPSTLGDSTNLGMFTAHDVVNGRVLDYPEIAIPLLFRDWEDHPTSAFGDGQLWDRYIWEGEVADLEVLDDLEQYKRPSVFVPGLGCTVNSMLELNNIKSTHGSKYDTTGVPRRHPNTGSFTPYHHAVTRAARDIPAGSELFAAYGETWIPWIPDVAVTQTKNLLEANAFLEDYQAFVQTKLLGSSSSSSSPKDYQVDKALLDRLWKLTRNFPIKSRPFSVLPYELNHEELFVKDSTTTTTTTTSTAELSIPDTRDYWRDRGVVSVEWLKRHGKCQDHLKPGVSTLPNVGRGAFAARNLPKGTVVGYAPLIHIGQRVDEALTIQYNGTTSYSSSSSSSDIKNKNYSKVDLVINYSFGHRDSTLVLTPYGAMVNYINHSKEKANVRIQWPAEEDLVAHKPEWLDKSLEFLRDTTNKVGLSFDYVALRDIEEGEEIFMDYGDEWQAAWDEHVQHWKPPMDADRYMHSTEFINNNHNEEETDDSSRLKTPAERLGDPYPPNLQTLCRESYRKDSATGKYVFLPVLRNDDTRVHCEVLKRRPHPKKKRMFLYTVRMTTATGQEIEVRDVPQPQGIDLYDKVFSQDWHLPQAFRNKMYVPDDIFPESWKNLKRE
jgi:hypothetical protein